MTAWKYWLGIGNPENVFRLILFPSTTRVKIAHIPLTTNKGAILCNHNMTYVVVQVDFHFPAKKEKRFSDRNNIILQFRNQVQCMYF